MENDKLFDVILEKHIGFGVRWDEWKFSFSFPFVTLIVDLSNLG